MSKNSAGALTADAVASGFGQGKATRAGAVDARHVEKAVSSAATGPRKARMTAGVTEGSKKKNGEGGARIRRTVLGLVVPVGVFAAWFLATNAAIVPESILPKPATVAATLGTMAADGTLGGDLGVSLLRVVVGFAAASALGIVVGTLCGMFRVTKELLLPTITAIRQIPLLAWIPLLILWCGIGELSKVVFIVMAAFFPIMMNTMEGIASTPLEYIEVARLNKLSPWKTFLRVYLPHALPHIQTGLKLGLGVSWMAVVGAELIASTSGIGYRMSYARTLMQSDVVIACMFVVGAVGIVMDKVVTVVFAALTPWERKGRDRS